MNKYILRMLLIGMMLIGSFYSATAAALAVAPPEPSAPGTCENANSGAKRLLSDSVYCTEINDGSNPIFGRGSLLYRITQIVVMAAGVGSVIMIIVGGFRYVLSGGDSANTKAAKDTILYAVIGLLIALVGQILVSLVLSKL